jgi:phosphoribosylanthranilate isomerase
MYIKICGITRSEIAVGCFESGADMIGVVYYPPSPRHVSELQANQILNDVAVFREKGKKVVLVVVDELPKKIDERFDYVQIHSKIRDELVSKIDCGIIRVVREFAELENLINGNEIISEEQLFILEMSRGILPGGNGKKWNWSMAKPFCKRFKTLIAGGVNPDNVAEVINSAKPFGVDVSSGVEFSAGIKDMTKVKKIIKIVKNL